GDGAALFKAVTGSSSNFAHAFQASQLFHHTSRASNLFRSREFLSRMGRRHLLPLPHSASDNRLTVIEPCLPPRCAEIVRTIVSGWPSALPTRECETSCLTWRAHGRGWLWRRRSGDAIAPLKADWQRRTRPRTARGLFPPILFRSRITRRSLRI